MERLTIISNNCYIDTVIFVSTRLNWGDALIDEAEHTLCCCERWILEISNVKAKVGACTIENFCDVILSSKKNWNSMACYTEAFLKSKKFDLEVG